ncbi:MAG TPA: hypothetical protein VF120_07820 [Ktedonobacterales bacterium]
MGPAWDHVFMALMEEFGAASDETWLVGGCLRDMLLGLPIGDLDLVTAADPLTLAQRLHARLGASVARLPRSVRVGIPPRSVAYDDSPICQVDISSLGESGLEDDLRARDFTINAMALPLRAWKAAREASLTQNVPSGLLDPTGGYADLRRGLLRLAGRAALRDDPGRILRGARHIARLGLTPTDETIALATDAGPLLRDLSPDRLRDELNLLLAEPGCAEGVTFLERAGAFASLFPELSESRAVVHALDSLRWTAHIQQQSDPDREQVDFGQGTPAGDWYAAPLPNGAPRITALRWGLLLHALAPHEGSALPGPRVERGSDAWGLRRLPRGPERRIAFEIEARASFTARLIAYREPDERDMRRLFAVAGEVTVDVLMAAAACASAQLAEGTMRADEARLTGERVGAILDLYFADPARLIPPPLLTGRDLIQGLGVAPGPLIHRLLAEVREAQLDGRVTSYAEALALTAEVLGEQAL